MPVICITTRIAAPGSQCFDIARDIDFHVQSLAATAERAIAGRTAGLIGLGESVTWEGRHLGLRQRFTAKVTLFEPPNHFQDVMTAGAFKSFIHDHYFEQCEDGTLMRDKVAFRSPLGPLGWLVDHLFLKSYLSRLLTGRCQAIKKQAELAWVSQNSRIASTSDWSVYRLDFAGNHFLVAKHLTEVRARDLVAEFEAHKHHQHYWAERVPDLPIDYAAVLRDSLRSGSSLNASLKVLRNQNASILDCINAIHQVRGVSLTEAEQMVLQATAWEDGRAHPTLS